MTDVFKTIKSYVTMQQAVEDCGLTVNRSGFVCCPFHNENTASMKIYVDSFHCFGCGEHGDVISFYQKLYNMKPLEAVRRINDTFGCGLSFTGNSKPSELKNDAIKQQRRKKEIDKLFGKWVIERFAAAVEYLSVLQGWQVFYAPLSEAEQIDERFIRSLSEYERVKYLCDVLEFGSNEEKQGLYIHNRKEVDGIYDRVQQLRAARN